MPNLKPLRKPENLDDALNLRDFFFELEERRDQIIKNYLRVAFSGSLQEAIRSPILEGSLRGVLEQYFYWVNAVCNIEIYSYPEAPLAFRDKWMEIWQSIKKDGPTLINDKGINEIDVIIESIHSAFCYMEQEKSLSKKMFLDGLKQAME